jgi:hypothetical protein
MALVLADRCQETSTTTGTGTLTLAGAVAGFQSFAAIGNGNTTYYTITNAAGSWEVGIGTYTSSGTTLSRTTVLASSNSGSLVNFTGTLNVFCDYPAEKAVYQDASGQVTISSQLNLTNASNYNLYASGAGANYMGGLLTFGSWGVGTAGIPNLIKLYDTGAPSTSYGLGISSGTLNIVSGGNTSFYNGGGTNVGGISAAGIWYLGGAAGSNSLQVPLVASAVNYIQVAGAATGAAPNIQTIGSDANISMTFSTKGSYGYGFYTGSFASQQFVIAATASAVNYMVAAGGATGYGTNLSASGTDTNIDMYLVPKGTGGLATYSTGQTTASLSTTTLGSGIGVFDTGGLAGNGGSVIFGAASGAWRFAAIKAYATNGGSNTQGDLFFSTRRIATDSTLTPAMQIASGGIAYLGGSSGAQSLQVTPVASAVNYWNFAGRAAGAAPYLQAEGSDTNIDLLYAAKGSGAHTFYTAGYSFTPQFKISHTASAVNYHQVTGSATGNAVDHSAQGSDTNISMTFTPKGTGSVYGPNYAASNGLLMNNATINTSYTLPSGYNAVSAGPITVASGVTVTVPSGSTWVVV